MNDEEIHWFTERLFWPHVKPTGEYLQGDTFRNIRSGQLYEIQSKHNEMVQFLDLRNGRLHGVGVASLQEMFDRGNIVWI